MSEPMSKREIEDVLSSIRRLVSQDGTGRIMAPAQAAPATSDARANKLVLTAALRVPHAPTAAPSPTVPDAATDAVGPAEDPAEVARPDPPARMATEFGPPLSDARAGQLASLGGTETGAPDTASPVDELAPSDTLFDDDETDITAGSQNAPDASLSDDNQMPAPQALDSDTPEDESVDVVLSRLEAALADKGLGGAPPAASADAETTTESDETPDQSPPLPDSASVDAAALHALVADMVRAELQGELGERITRNIRKLVRAEVAREMQLRKQ